MCELLLAFHFATTLVFAMLPWCENHLTNRQRVLKTGFLLPVATAEAFSQRFLIFHWWWLQHCFCPYVVLDFDPGACWQQFAKV
jgi:hypothetical protein